jgi:Ca2+-binding RTX toxin-like protein
MRLVGIAAAAMLAIAPLQQCEQMPPPSGDQPLAWSVPDSGNRVIDTLSDDYRWSSDVITYALTPQDIDGNGVNDWDEGIWRANIAAIFNNLDSFLAIRFEEGTPGQAVINLSLSPGATFIEGRSDSPDPFGDGIGETRVSIIPPVAGASFAAQPGDARMLALWHEIGHALGLVHPFITTNGIDDATGSSNPEDAITGIWDAPGTNYLNSWSYTVMTYRGYHWGEDNAFTTAIDPNLVLPAIGTGSYTPFDIATLQYLYGKNTTTGAGNDTYSFNDNNEQSDGLRTIWDTAGIDTIDYTGPSRVRINLNDATLQREIGGGGFLSTSETLSTGFHIANGVVIENAIGGPQADSIVGNEAANTLTGLGGDDAMSGGPGNDVLVPGPGNNVIDGGTGDDTVVVAGTQAGGSVIDYGNGSYFVRSQDQSASLISGVELLQFDDTTVRLQGAQPDLPTAPVAEPVPTDQAAEIDPGDTPPPDETPGIPAPPAVQPGNGGTFVGTPDVDNLGGTNGDDTISGLERGDYLYGFDGNDTIITGPGQDFVYGGAGIDTVVVPLSRSEYNITIDANGTGNLLPVDPLQILANTKFVNDIEVIVFEASGERVEVADLI